jgi:uncharacterized protein (TIGR02246 family)
MLRVVLLFSLLFVISPAFAQESARHSDDEQAIRRCIDTYVDAFNRGDASTIASLWSEQGVWVSPDGERLTGRSAIETAMAQYFEETQRESVSLSNTKIRFLAPSVAVEEGSARVLQQGAPPTDTTYIAIHVKRDGRWQLDSVRETSVPVASSSYDHLKELEWLIGTWIDKDEESVLELTCSWTKNKNFLTRAFRVKIEDRIEMEGTQVIGYDGVNNQIRSWVFDTDGGIGEGVWHHDGEKWIVKHTHRHPTGQLGSAITILKQIDENHYVLQSTGRELDGEILPDIEPVTVVRK